MVKYFLYLDMASGAGFSVNKAIVVDEWMLLFRTSVPASFLYSHYSAWDVNTPAVNCCPVFPNNPSSRTELMLSAN